MDCSYVLPIGSRRGIVGWTIVDLDDHASFAEHRLTLNPDGYVLTSIKEKGEWNRYRLHRLIMKADHGATIDHINGNKRDNRKDNLRSCSITENCRNSKAAGKIRYKGVRDECKGTKRYRARIHVDSRSISLGYFATPEEAARAYDAAALEHFGEFAKTNEMLGLL